MALPERLQGCIQGTGSLVEDGKTMIPVYTIVLFGGAHKQVRDFAAWSAIDCTYWTAMASWTAAPWLTLYPYCILIPLQKQTSSIVGCHRPYLLCKQSVTSGASILDARSVRACSGHPWKCVILWASSLARPRSPGKSIQLWPDNTVEITVPDISKWTCFCDLLMDLMDLEYAINFECPDRRGLETWCCEVKTIFPTRLGPRPLFFPSWPMWAPLMYCWSWISSLQTCSTVRRVRLENSLQVQILDHAGVSWCFQYVQIQWVLILWACDLRQKVVNITKKQSCLTRLSHDYTDCIIHDMLHLTGFTVRTSEINLAGYEVELLETHPLIDGKTTKVPPDASLRNSAQMFSRSDSLQ